MEPGLPDICMKSTVARQLFFRRLKPLQKTCESDNERLAQTSGRGHLPETLLYASNNET
ncbi:9389_t:CDS:2 [Acaulospora colombiana]|uniref:9389_t:CDS:1 n=1 Tax=Acaulospora colombiana TaxID=27376 RepID=A0ACA9L0W7_9GLOM|nr:9389_t:CDS:2 [Acaulospora colombiana]